MADVASDGETIEVPRSLLEQLLKKVEALEAKLQVSEKEGS
jgi:BMFP domain-containing protein YqiC